MEYNNKKKINDLINTKWVLIFALKIYNFFTNI